MTLPIVSESVHLTPSGAKDMLSKIRTFAIAQGWTSVEYQTSVQWSNPGSGYSWNAGTEDFLELLSSGWAYQQLRYRFRVDALGNMTVKAVDPNYPTYSAVSTHPVLQYSFGPNALTGVSDSILNYPSGVFPALYLFGNKKFIAWHAQVLTSGIISHFIGTMNWFKPFRTRNDLQMILTSYSSSYANDYTQMPTQPTSWQCCYGWQPSSSSGEYCVWWNGDKRDYNYVAICTRISRDEADTFVGRFAQYRYAMALNNFSGRRPLINPAVYGFDSDGQYMILGRTWHSWFRFEGLQIGQTLDYQSEQYRVFPTLLSNYPWGVAYRIA